MGMGTYRPSDEFQARGAVVQATLKHWINPFFPEIDTPSQLTGREGGRKGGREGEGDSLAEFNGTVKH